MNCPLTPEEMAWPFKTTEQREALAKWYAQLPQDFSELGDALL